jgi:glycosyltransferase involved in cell wall biosynthesis
MIPANAKPLPQPARAEAETGRRPDGAGAPRAFHGTVWLLASVGGGPLERLAQRLSEEGVDARLCYGIAATGWRRLMALGALGRMLARLRAMVLFPAQAILTLMARGPGAVVVSTNPFFLPHLITATRFLHRKRVVALVYDLYPDALEGGGVVVRDGVVARIATAMNRALFRRADGVVFIGAKMAAHARARYGDPRRWTILETGADLREFASPRPAAEDAALDAWRRDAVLFAYVGNMGVLHDWETLARGIALVAASPIASRVRFLVAGSGANLSRLRDACRQHDDGLVRFRGPLEDEEWARLMPAVDVALVTLKAEANRTSIPSKTFSAMAAGAAILAVVPRDSDVGDVVEVHRCGLRVDPGDPGAFLAAAERFVGRTHDLEGFKRAGTQAVRDHYDMSALAPRWMRFIDEASRPAGVGSGAEADD